MDDTLYMILQVAVAVFTSGLLGYIYGVNRGKKYATRVVTLEFQQVIHKILHLVAKEDHTNLHLLLQDLVEVPEKISEEIKAAD